MVRITIAGAAGRMGESLLKAADLTSEIKVTVALEHASSKAIGRDAGEQAGLLGLLGTTITDSLDGKEGEFDVLVDFTRPESTINHLDFCKSHGKGMVIGTTGFSESQRKEIKSAAEDTAVMLAPNMSVGVNLSLKLLELAAKVMGDHTDIEIVESHHRHKVDAPSGTALRMGEVIADTLGRDLKECAIYGREGHTGERDQKTIGFSTIRAGDIVGEHTVMFVDEGERVEITHKATSRMTFANGAMRAALWIANREKGLYDMQDVLGLKE